MPNTLKEYDGLIIKGFEVNWSHDKKIAKLHEKHIQPEKDAQATDWGNLAAETGIEKKDLAVHYALFKRQEEAKLLDEDDRNRILDSLRIVNHAQYSLLDHLDGEVVDFEPLAISQDKAMKADEDGDDEAKAVH